MQVRCTKQDCQQEYRSPVFFCARCGEPLVQRTRIEAGGMVINVELHDGNVFPVTALGPSGPLAVHEVQLDALQNQVVIVTASERIQKKARGLFDAIPTGVWKLD